MKLNIENHVVMLSILLVHSTASYCQNSMPAWPLLKGSYLGQEAPGLTSKIFAPGIVSTGMSELNPVFSPDEIYLFFTSSGSTTPALPEKPLNYSQYLEELNKPENGSTDIWWVDSKVIYVLTQMKEK